MKIAYDNALAHLIEAGSDMFLMPSRYEPCGLNQLYSLKYGTVPIVRAVGGLDDTIKDEPVDPQSRTGFKFDDYTVDAMLGAMERALAVYRSPRGLEADGGQMHETGLFVGKIRRRIQDALRKSHKTT